jgi:hypothetical protein
MPAFFPDLPGASESLDALQPRIQTIKGHQLGVCAQLDELATFEHYNPVRVLNGGQAVRESGDGGFGA